jgi:ribosomal protein S18
LKNVEIQKMFRFKNYSNLKIIQTWKSLDFKNIQTLKNYNFVQI